VKTGRKPVSVVQVNYAFDKQLTDPDQLLDRYFTLTGWSDALVRAGAGPVAVVQRFHRDVEVVRNGVDYVFRREAIPAAVAARRPDVAHVNGLIFPVRTWRLRRALGRAAAVVVQSHSDGGAIGREPALRLLGRAARGAVDAFLFAADQHAAAWRQAGLVGRDQPVYQVMPASSTLQPFDAALVRPIDRAAAREVSGVSGSPATLWVGRLNANKDPLTVLDAFERALPDLPDATLTMIFGTGELFEEVRARIARSPALSACVRLTGLVPRERMAAFYSAADLFVVGSHHEGSGYSLMEACACGALPVVTDIPTFRLMTGAGAVGALWTPGDAGGCARALTEVGRRDFDAERARLADHFTRELSWDAVGRRALAIYGEVVNSRRSAVGRQTEAAD
jgi:glycosyltransferase involved in cell wall biosynthesis